MSITEVFSITTTALTELQHLSPTSKLAMSPKRRRRKLEFEEDRSSGDEYGRAKRSVRHTATRGKAKKAERLAQVPIIDALYEVSIQTFL